MILWLLKDQLLYQTNQKGTTRSINIFRVQIFNYLNTSVKIVFKNSMKD